MRIFVLAAYHMRRGARGHRLRRYACRLIADRGQIITFISKIFYNFDIFT